MPKPDSSPPMTLNEVIARERAAEEERSRACVEAIKQIHAAGPNLVVAASEAEWRSFRVRAWIGRGPGAIAKYSPHKKVLLGWYRKGQHSGKPNPRMPIAQDLAAEREHYFKQLRKAVPERFSAHILGLRSGRVRQENGIGQHILEMHQQLSIHGVPKHHHAKRIAMALECSVDYVRRVLRRTAARPTNKNVT